MLVRKLRLTGKAVSVATATVMVSGVAATWMAGSAFADPGPMLIATKTVVTGTSQQPDDSLGAVLKVNVQVTAKGGSSAPTGDVIVNVGPSNNCAAAVSGPAGSRVSTGSCEVHNLADQTYNVYGAYRGSGNWSASSTTGRYAVQLNPYRHSHSHVVSSLTCSRSVTIGGHGSCALTVINKGWHTASGVTADIALPSRLKVRGCGHGHGWGWLTGRSGGCWVSGNTATWKIGSLAAGAAKTQTLTFSVKTDGYPWGYGRHHHRNAVTVKAAADTPAQAPSTSKATVVIHPRSGWFW